MKKLIVIALAWCAAAAGFAYLWRLWRGVCAESSSGLHCPCWYEGGQCDFCEFGDGPHDADHLVGRAAADLWGAH